MRTFGIYRGATGTLPHHEPQFRRADWEMEEVKAERDQSDQEAVEGVFENARRLIWNLEIGNLGIAVSTLQTLLSK